MTRVNPKRKKARAGYMISAVSELYKLHPQTLRLYERVGLLKPSRSDGNTRLYTDSDLERLEVILTLTREMGVNLAGIEIILNMREKMAEMQHQMEAFTSFVQQELARGIRSGSARPQDNALAPLDVDRPVRSLGGDADHPPRERLFANELGQPCIEDDVHALRARARCEAATDPAR